MYWTLLGADTEVNAHYSWLPGVLNIVENKNH